MATNYFNKKPVNYKNCLSIYLTAGFPDFDECLKILFMLEKQHVDFIELGMPYSDPLADGLTIQQSSTVAIKNGMTMANYFNLLKALRKKSKLPVVYMGYLNQIMQFGVEKFCIQCEKNQVASLIIPDLPIEVYKKEFKVIFDKYNLRIGFLITPTTSNERIRIIEKLTTGFIYIVSSNAITGKRNSISIKQIDYYKRIKSLNLSKPYFIGFGIHDKKSFNRACDFANGAIIGSEFIRQVSKNNASQFLKSIKS